MHFGAGHCIDFDFDYVVTSLSPLDLRAPGIDTLLIVEQHRGNSFVHTEKLGVHTLHHGKRLPHN